MSAWHQHEYFLRHRRIFILVFHLAAVCFCYLAAYLLRFDFAMPADERLRFLQTLPLLAIIKLTIFWRYRLFEGWWGYPSFSDLWNIVMANALGSGLFVVAMVFSKTSEGMSRSVLLVDGVVCIGLLASTRFGVLALKQLSAPPRRIEKYVLMVGAGEAAVRLLQEIESNPRLGISVVGLVDDDRAKWGMRIHGIRVFGGTEQIPKVVEAQRVQELVIAMPSAPPEELRRIVQTCQSTGVACKVLPPMAALIEGEIPYRMVRDVRLEDLLGRRPVRLARDKVQAYLDGRVVLITGGAGSIGSELARQIANFNPEEIVLLDRNENALFLLEMELRVKYPELKLAVAVGDIQCRTRLADVFRRYTPDCVFHAAAYKHVPLMEENPLEAVKNNVLGTLNVLEAAQNLGTRDFVLISTDKAIRPTSVMGATKRIAELTVQSQPHAPKSVAVRFGNVLGSAGSVVNLFREQISVGGPVTVTHPEATRFFMTVQEAVQLILQAATLGRGGEVLVLDMGEPVKILDLAKNLIRLSGLEPEVDVPIRFIGLRPGEKLHEELWYQEEQIGKTALDKIWVLRNHKVVSVNLSALLAELGAAVDNSDAERVLELIRTVVSEFQPSAKLQEALAGARSARA